MPNEKPITYTPEQIKEAAERCKSGGECDGCAMQGCGGCGRVFRDCLLDLETENAELRDNAASYRQVKKVLADNGFSDIETMISRYKQVMADANEVDITKDEELADLRAQLAESQRRERAAVEEINAHRYAHVKSCKNYDACYKKAYDAMHVMPCASDSCLGYEFSGASAQEGNK